MKKLTSNKAGSIKNSTPTVWIRRSARFDKFFVKKRKKGLVFSALFCYKYFIRFSDGIFFLIWGRPSRPHQTARIFKSKLNVSDKEILAFLLSKIQFETKSLKNWFLARGFELSKIFSPFPANSTIISAMSLVSFACIAALATMQWWSKVMSVQSSLILKFRIFKEFALIIPCYLTKTVILLGYIP